MKKPFKQIRCAIFVLLTFSCYGTYQFARAQTPPALKLNTGKEIYRAACAACHGGDGRGLPEAELGFEPPSTYPNFTDCNATTRETNLQWRSIVSEGGEAKGFSQIMPSFREALTREQIGKVVQHLRTFCRDGSWPPGDLNLPRPLVTEKAFPEDELVWTSSVNATGSPGGTSGFVYEKRLGKMNQFEVKAPFSYTRAAPGRWYGGTDDMSLGFKRVVTSSRKTGTILSVFGEAYLPTGNTSRGIGTGVTVFETFAAAAQLLPKQSFVQTQGGFEFPTDTNRAPRAAFWRVAAGKSVSGNRGYGRMWSPMIELLMDRDLVPGARTNWDVLPQFQVTLNKRQHIRFCAGYQRPVTNTGGRSSAVQFYLLWDIFDGGLLDGW